MNLLPFIIAILLVLSYGASSLMQKHFLASKTHASYLGLRRAERALLRKSEGARYAALPGVPVKVNKSEAASNSPQEKKLVPEPMINPNCARLNLFPLLVEDKQTHPELYAQALKLLELFYQKKLFGENRAQKLLDRLLLSAKKKLSNKEAIPLESLVLEDKELQSIYYMALKGTKKCELNRNGYPPLIDFLKIDPNPSPICLFHAHPHMLAPFFGVKNARPLYQKLHTECKSGIELSALLLLVDAHELSFVDPKVWALLDFHRSQHSSMGRKAETLAAEDAASGISLRRNISRY
jgi:hypothetical protein